MLMQFPPKGVYETLFSLDALSPESFDRDMEILAQCV